MTWSSEANPSAAKQRVLARRGADSPKTTTPASRLRTEAAHKLPSPLGEGDREAVEGGRSRTEAWESWRDAAAETLKREAGVVVFGESVPRLANTLCFAAEGFASELQVMALDLAGVMVSAGSACSSGKVRPSHVLTAMGHADLAACAIRVSGGWATTEQDWVRFADAWLHAHARHLARRQSAA